MVRLKHNKKSWEIKDHAEVPDIETPRRLLKNSYFIFRRKLERSNFCKKLGDKNFIHKLSDGCDFDRIGGTASGFKQRIAKKRLYAEHLRRNSKYLREYSFKKINLNSQYALRVSMFYRNKRT